MAIHFFRLLLLSPDVKIDRPRREAAQQQIYHFGQEKYGRMHSAYKRRTNGTKIKIMSALGACRKLTTIPTLAYIIQYTQTHTFWCAKTSILQLVVVCESKSNNWIWIWRCRGPENEITLQIWDRFVHTIAFYNFTTPLKSIEEYSNKQ